MSQCGFCHRMFRSPQAVKAHLKHCARYKTDKSKNSTALGRLPKAAVTSTPVQPNPPVEAPNLTAPLRDLVTSMCGAMTKQHAPHTPQQQRRTILQAAKAQVIDRYGTPLGQITASLRGAAKLQIERELASLPLEELPFGEVCEIAGAIRDRLYAITFRRQARDADRQRVELETRKKKEVETLGALLRADRRKKTFLQQAHHQAHAYCQERAIIGWDHLSVLTDIESRLEVFLTGDEPILEAQAVVRSVLEARYAEADATLAAAQAKAAERWHEEVAATLVLGTFLATPLLAQWYPTQMLAIISWIERIFALTSEAATPTPEAAAQAPPAASAEACRRKAPVAPSNPESSWGNSVGGEPAHA